MILSEGVPDSISSLIIFRTNERKEYVIAIARANE